MKTEAFQNGDVKASHTVAFISVSGRFSVNDRRKRIKTYALSNESSLVWTGEKGYENATVDKNYLLRFLRNENGDF